jgi:hypothetical protein
MQAARLAFVGGLGASAAPVWGKVSRDVALTHGGADGNRLVAGQGHLPERTPVDVSLPGRPDWIVGVPADAGASIWTVILADGTVSAWRTIDQTIEPITLESAPPRLPAGSPPALVAAGAGVELITVPELLAPSPLSPPTLVDDAMAFIDRSGDLVLVARDEPERVLARYAVNALPDARLLHDGSGRTLTLAGATADRYVHGVLGDDLEAAGFAIARVSPPALLQQVPLPAPDVIEGIAPIWVDVDADGRHELVVTISNAAEGGRLAILSEAGEILALGPGFGRGGRWRHPLAVAPFGPEGETEIASVRTPHIGGVVEFSRWEGDQLTTVATLGGYSSHVLGSRNLDMALAGDFDGDEQLDLLVPNQARSALAGIRRTASAEGAEATWELPLGGTLSTNLATVTGADGRLSLAAGRTDDVIRLWLA